MKGVLNLNLAYRGLRPTSNASQDVLRFVGREHLQLKFLFIFIFIYIVYRIMQLIYKK
jgi:hypothetical protein